MVNPDNKRCTKGVVALDTMASHSFVTEEVVDSLQLPCVKAGKPISCTGLGGVETQASQFCIIQLGNPAVVHTKAFVLPEICGEVPLANGRGNGGRRTTSIDLLLCATDTWSIVRGIRLAKKKGEECKACDEPSISP